VPGRDGGDILTSGPGALRALAEPWQPYRALAARLLWHHWRHVTGRPAMDDIVTI